MHTKVTIFILSLGLKKGVWSCLWNA